MQEDSPTWRPAVDDYVVVRTTGELGLVAGVGGADGAPRFLVRVYPQAEAASPHVRRLVAEPTSAIR